MKRITPSREALLGVRNALDIKESSEDMDSASPKNRNKLIYCSREHETSRSVKNEKEILDAIDEHFDKLDVIVFEGSKNGDNLDDIIDLFSDAAVVMGPHGAGLSHTLFSSAKKSDDDQSTTVVEFQFMRDPPMMFWHLAETLGLDYWMVPVPASYWMMDEMEVSVDEVLDILHETVPEFATETAIEDSSSYAKKNIIATDGNDQEFTVGITTKSSCPRGAMKVSSDDTTMKCVLCPPGTYKFQRRDEESCKACFHGRYSSGFGNVACRTCPIGTYANSSKECTPCPEDTVSWMPGGFDAEEHCRSQQAHLQLMNDIDKKLKGLDHISPEKAVRIRRAMLECPQQFNETVNGFASPYVDGFSGPYVDGFSGPYVDGFSGPYVDGFSGPYVEALSGNITNCDALNPPVLASSNFVTNSTCPTGLSDVNTRECASCGVSKALTITTSCVSFLTPSSSNEDPTEACCQAAETFNNGGCFCDINGLKIAGDFDITSQLISSISEKCSFMPMNMEVGNCPRGSTMRSASDQDTSNNDGDDDDKDNLALWALLLLIIPGLLVLLLLWKLFAACCCRRRTLLG